ncbi:uncharacterized protein LOC132200529 [Neocloeon triangulifer]|uniref:uncharacterized protein LOC132200529 n=1 Tax=Neocloeon triangulifer TaxID=2078957 RepID=UPI00286ED9E4|nr:uncharacterized protein LOC132200529 [Neocloeon triangulifer]XP_059482031.1 uncharacterized protein LOC132200529 [Neocloeon triangulifer]
MEKPGENCQNQGRETLSEPPPFEFDLPPINNQQVHEVVINELFIKLRLLEIKLRQMQHFEAKNEGHLALTMAENKKLLGENSLLRLENMAIGAQAKSLATSAAVANSTCQRLQEEVLALRVSLERANHLRLRVQEEANELRSKFEVALQVQVVCLKGEDQAKGQLNAALKELEKLKEELANKENHEMLTITAKLQSLTV